MTYLKTIHHIGKKDGSGTHQSIDACGIIVYNEYARNNLPCNRTSIVGVIVSVLASIAVNLGSVPLSCSTKDYYISYLLLLCSITEEERRFVVWESWVTVSNYGHMSILAWFGFMVII
jgi:hypothetical protein